jgi:hypothetical protein
LPFVVHPTPGFEILGRVGSQIIVGPAGTRLPDKSGRPHLVFAASTEFVSASQLAPTAAGLVKKITPDLFVDRVVRTTRTISVAGKPAHEIVAAARHSDGYPVSLYVVVIADGVGHIQIVGISRLDEQATSLPAFRQIVATLSLR